MDYILSSNELFKCDVYVHKTKEGYFCRVAKYRTANIDQTPYHPSIFSQDLEAYQQGALTFTNWLTSSGVTEKIEHPLAGELVRSRNVHGLSDLLLKLKSEGLRILPGMLGRYAELAQPEPINPVFNKLVVG